MYSSPDYHMKDEGQLFILALFIVLLAGWHFFRRKSIPLTGADVALKLGLHYSARITRNIQPKLAFINRLQYGKKHYALHTFSGTFRGYQIAVFDFIYEVEVMNGKSGSYVKDPYSFYILYLPRSFDEVTIYKEGLLSKLKQLTVDNDIDFESFEFSRKFRVRSTNPKLAYDFCNARMMEYLLEHKSLSIELDQKVLCISFDRPLKFEEVQQNLISLVQIRKLMPDYLFEA